MGAQSGSTSRESVLQWGLADLALGSYDKAVADLNEAIAYTPEFAAKMAVEGSPLSDDLLSNLESTQSFADVPLAYMYRGIAYLGQGDPTKAIGDFDKAIELRPDLPERATIGVSPILPLARLIKPAPISPGVGNRAMLQIYSVSQCSSWVSTHDLIQVVFPESWISES